MLDEQHREPMCGPDAAHEIAELGHSPCACPSVGWSLSDRSTFDEAMR